MANRSIVQKITPYLWIMVACAIYAVGFSWCFAPNQIAFGGITGIAQIINNFVPLLPIGGMVIVFNLPLFFLGWKFIGGRLLVTSLFAMGVSSLMIDGLDATITFAPMDPLLACVFGGLLVGGSLGIIFRQGATTGGTDLMARLVKLKAAWLPMGKILMMLDLVVVVGAGIAFGRLSATLYGLIAIYISTLVMDQVLYGLDNAKVAYIISNHHEEISKLIIQNVDRGVTVLHGEGGYTGTDKKVLMVAFKQREIVAIRQTVKELDPDAFLIVCDAHEVLGSGFRTYKKNDI